MISISPKPLFNTASPQSIMTAAYDQPFNIGREFGESFMGGLLTSPVIGTVIRNNMTPTGAPPADRRTQPMFGTLEDLGNVRSLYDQVMRGVGLQETPKAMTQSEWEASDYARERIAWDPGMTEERAAALAHEYDIKEAREMMLDRTSWDGPFGLRLPSAVAFAGSFAGQAFDPINYIPIFGEAAAAAAVARYGWQGIAKVGALSAGNAVDAAVSTAIFGLLTASQRAKFGDDVSWQAQVSDIAMSALIGATITPVLHGLGSAYSGGRRLASQVKKRAENVPTVKTSRSVLNDAVVGLATDGQVSLSPKSIAALERMQVDAEDRAAALQALSQETVALRSDEPAKAGQVVETASGARVAVKPVLVEASTVQPVRAPSEASVRSVQSIATGLDPARLMPSTVAGEGAPVVGMADSSGARSVASGNTRTEAIQMAYQTGNGDAYRQALEEAGYDTTGFAQPMLALEQQTPLSPEAQRQFAAEANQPRTADLSPADIIDIDRQAIAGDTVLDFKGGDVLDDGNQMFVERYLTNLAAPERAAVVDRHGNLTADGKQRLENALVAYAFGEEMPSVIQRFTSGRDHQTRTIVAALASVAHRWADITRMMKSGALAAEFDMTPEVAMALHNLSRWRQAAAASGSKFSDVAAAQIRPFDQPNGKRMSLIAKTIARLFYKTDDFGQVAPRDVIAGRLNAVLDQVERMARIDRVEDAEAAAKLGVIDEVDHEQADVFAVDGLEPGTGGSSPPRAGQPGFADSGDTAQGAGADRGGRPAIAAAIQERMTRAGRPADEASALGAMVTSFYETMAQRTGRTVQDLVNTFGVPEFQYLETLDDLTSGTLPAKIERMAQAERASNAQLREMRQVLDDADAALAALKNKATTAVDNFVGLGPMARNNPDAWGMMHADDLERIVMGDDPDGAAELEAAFAPVREQLRRIFGDSLPLYRVQGRPYGAKGTRAVLSWSADPEFSRRWADLGQRQEEATEAEIRAAEDTYQREGRVKIGAYWLVHEGSQYPVIYPDRRGEPALDDMVTDTDSVRDYIEGNNKWARDHNARYEKRAADIIQVQVPLDEVVYATDRAGQAEFMVRNIGPIHVDENGQLVRGETPDPRYLFQPADRGSQYFFDRLSLDTRDPQQPDTGGMNDGRASRSDGVSAVQGQAAQPAGNGGREADGSLRGLPRKVGNFRPSAYPEAQQVAARYMAKAGLPYNPPNTYARVDPERAARIAQAYDEMPHTPDDPEVKAAYQAMADETLAQYEAMLEDGIVIEFIPSGGPDPYAGNPRNMTEDVRNNRHMWVFSTRDGFGSDASFDPVDNPLLADSGFTISGQPAMVNDIFRAVHDYFGHVKEGVGFRADGEENAWRAHSSMYSPQARRAMTTETRGQNSWVNYGPYGEANRTATSENTRYADQKIGLLPDWVVNEGAGDDAPSAAPRILMQGARPDQTETPAFKAWFGDSKVVDENGRPLVVYHGSPEGKFDTFDPTRPGKTSVLFSVVEDHRQGFYFAERRGFAEGFADQDGRNRRGAVMEVYLSLQNPLDVTSMDNATVRALEEVGAEAQRIDPEINNPDYYAGKAGHDDFWELLSTADGGATFVQALRNLGYDGLKMIEQDLETADPNYVPDDNGAVTWVAFDQGQIKSATENSGDFNPRNPNILFQSPARLPEPLYDAAVVEPVIRASSLETSFADVAVNTYPTGRELKLSLERRVQQAAGQAGIDLTIQNDQNRAILARAVVQDALYALKSNANAVGWYDATVREAMAVMTLLHPELASDPHAELMFKAALAITSNGQKVDKNFEMTEQAYAHWKRTGRLPERIGSGTAAKNIDAGMRMINQLVDEWGPERVRSFLDLPFTVGQLKAMGFNITGEGVDVVVRGSAILGPKIGNGFYSNLNGHFDALTIDRWLMRTWGRLIGKLIDNRPDKVKAKGAELKGFVKQLQADKAAAKAFTEATGVKLRTGNMSELAVAIHKASTDSAVRERMNQAGPLVDYDGERDTLGSVIRKVGNSLWKYLDGQIEQPTPKQRPFIRATLGDALKELQKQPGLGTLNMSDLQALLWYPEKRLYDSAKQDDISEGYTDDEAPDYANAARKVARAAGISEADIAAATKENSNGRAARVRPSDGGSGSPLPAPATIGEAVGRLDRAEQKGRAAILKRHIFAADRVGRERDGSPRVFAGKGPGDDRGLRGVRTVFTPSVKFSNVLEKAELKPVTMHELEPGEENTARFHKAISDSKAAANKFGAAVYVYPLEDYATFRLFMSEDGKGGFALKPDGDIVSVFSSGGGAVHAMLTLAVEEGGTKLDAFDTVLPEIYSINGFKEVARDPWNEDYKPDDWDFETFKDFNDGRPDIVYMEYQPAQPMELADVEAKGKVKGKKPKTLMQGPRGAIQLDQPGRSGSLITLFAEADASTALHEMGHHFLHMFRQIAMNPKAPPEVVADMQRVTAWWASNAKAVAADSPHAGVTEADVLKVLREGTSGDDAKDVAIDVGLHEQWARGFEQYVRNGKAPNPGLKGAFEQFRRWLLSIYQKATDLNVKLSPEMKGVFDRMLGMEQQQAIAARAEATSAAAPTPKVDGTPPRPEPLPDGLEEAAKRVHQVEDFRALAEQYGVKEDGSFDEEADIEAMRARGELTEEDEAELAEAQAVAEDANEWVKALKTAAQCAFGVN